MKRLIKCVSVFVLSILLIPIVKAQTPAEAYESGKLTLKSIPLSKETDRDWYLGNILGIKEEWDGYTLVLDETAVQNGDYTKGKLSKLSGDPVDVVITYEYDEAVRKVAADLIENFGEVPAEFEMNDIESIAYMAAAQKYLTNNPDKEGTEPGVPEGIDFSAFCGKFLKKIKYKNFDFEIGMGGGTFFYNEVAGELSFIYNDVYYGSVESTGVPSITVIFRNAVYVPEGTTDVVKAIKDRVSKYFNVTSVEAATKVVASETVPYTAEDYYKFFLEEYWRLNPEQLHAKYNTADLYVKSMTSDPDTVDMWSQLWEDEHETQAFIEKYGAAAASNKNIFLGDMTDTYNPDDLGGVEKTAQIYNITLKDGTVVKVVAVEDTEKSNDNRKVITSDAGTGIEVESNGIVPIDTLIHVARITDGDDYKKIVKILNTTNVDMFDLKMITKTNNETISKLDNGKFRIKLPIKEEFKGKELKVYYVGANDKVEEYAVTISDDGNYAIFETDHFSIYTLAAGAATKNPKTGDNIMIYVATLILSSLYLLVRKTRKN